MELKNSETEITFSDETVLHVFVLQNTKFSLPENEELVKRTVEALSSHCREVHATITCQLSNEMREFINQHQMNWLLENAGIKPE